jgi:hypothetical protein
LTDTGLLIRAAFIINCLSRIEYQPEKYSNPVHYYRGIPSGY